MIARCYGGPLHGQTAWVTPSGTMRTSDGVVYTLRQFAIPENLRERVDPMANGFGQRVAVCLLWVAENVSIETVQEEINSLCETAIRCLDLLSEVQRHELAVSEEESRLDREKQNGIADIFLHFADTQRFGRQHKALYRAKAALENLITTLKIFGFEVDRELGQVRPSKKELAHAETE